MPTEPILPPGEQTQPNVQSSIIPPVAPAPVRKTKYTIFIAIFIIVAVLEAVVSYFLFIKKPPETSSTAVAVPTVSLLPSPTPTSVRISTPSAIPSPQVPQVSPTPKKVTCVKDDQNCIFTNIIDNFTNGCKPTEVTTTVDTGQQVTLTISSGANGACRFQMKGLGVDQDCLFAKENVTLTVIKGTLGMDNIPKDPEFIKIKAASCK